MYKTLVIVIAAVVLMTSNAHSGSIVEVARSQLGMGEIGGGNRGPVVKKYTKGKEVAWCAGFVSWVLENSGKGKSYILRARSYWDMYRANRVKNPASGDIIVFKRGNGKGHAGIVESVNGTKITTIEGNVGKYPAKVKRISYQLGKIPNLIGFVRI